jgi:hypothetical protein
MKSSDGKLPSHQNWTTVVSSDPRSAPRMSTGGEVTGNEEEHHGT